MKNLTVYVGTIKKCLNLEEYKLNGDETFITETQHSTIEIGLVECNTTIINKQAILIKNKTNNYYEFKLTNTLLDNINIILGLSKNVISNKPKQNDDIFVDESTLVPYYEKQPKVLSLRNLKNHLLYDLRIKNKI